MPASNTFSIAPEQRMEPGSSTDGRRLLIPGGLLLLSLLFYALLSAVAPQPDGAPLPFVALWAPGFLIYFAACIYVLRTRPLAGRRAWLELGLILLGALLFRAMLLPLPTGLSRDAWRYLFDAKMILHGYDPYVIGPADPRLLHLRDAVFSNMRYRNVPTEYPPLAEGVFVLSALIAPGNMLALKAIFVLCDLLACAVLACYLARKGLDARRCIIYAWCPLPIVEFAVEGHLDVLAVLCVALIFLASSAKWRHADLLVGALIGLGVLAKYYPLLLLIVFFRPWNWRLPAACLATILLGYLPFIIAWPGDNLLGVFIAQQARQGLNAGPVQLLVRWLCRPFGVSLPALLNAERAASLLTIGAAALSVFLLRRRARLSSEAGTLILIGALFSVASNVFPWYVAVLLLPIAILARPIWTRKTGLDAGALAIAAVWYFTCAVIASYIPGYWNTPLLWNGYYMLAYGVVLLALGIAALFAVWKWRWQVKRGRNGDNMGGADVMKSGSSA